VNALQTLITVEAAAATALVALDARAHLPRPSAVRWTLATLGTLGLAAPVYLIVRPTGRPQWGFAEVAALPLFFILAILPFSVLIDRLGPHIGLSSSLGFIFVLTALQNAVFAGAALYVVLRKYRLPPSSIGLTRGPWVRRLVAAAIASAAALGGNVLGQNLTIFAASLFVGSQAATEFVTKQTASTPVFRLLREFRAPIDIAMLITLVGFVVPVGEEIFFRGLAFGAFRRALGRHAGVMASAVFFAAAHVQPVEFFPILILGTILAYLYEYTGSLVPGMIAHAVNNLAALALFYVTPPVVP
jgi:membrane protease YdiL (CAAX protease family)